MMASQSDFQALMTDLMSQHQEMIKELYARQDMIMQNQKDLQKSQNGLAARLEELDKKLRSLLKEHDSGVH